MGYPLLWTVVAWKSYYIKYFSMEQFFHLMKHSCCRATLYCMSTSLLRLLFTWVPLYMGSFSHGSLFTWVSLYMGLSLHGSLFTWVPLYMGLSLHGSLFTWVSLYMGSSLHGFLFTWVPLYRGPSLHRSLFTWVPLYIGSSLYGTLFSWDTLEWDNLQGTLFACYTGFIRHFTWNTL